MNNIHIKNLNLKDKKSRRFIKIKRRGFLVGLKVLNSWIIFFFHY